MVQEKYIPNARDAIVAYFGINARGVYRVHCVKCRDENPLTDAHPIYGDLYIPTGPMERVDDGDECDLCRVRLLTLSQLCQQEHDEQQKRFAREWRAGEFLEYGTRSAIRCRVY